LISQHTLARSNADLQKSLERLSTGLRINTGKDDPAGLIASETLRRDIAAISKAVSNSQRATELIATADVALSEVSKILVDVRSLITEAANAGALSTDQIDANQLQIDSSLEAVDRISQTTTFQGRKLLDGSLDFITGSLSSGYSGTVTKLSIEQANLGSAGSVTVDVDITTAADRAQITVTSTAFALSDDLVVKISGKTGAEVFSFSSGASITQVVNAINLVSDATGVTAANSSGELDLRSTEYGTEAFVAVEVISEGSAGDFSDELSGNRDTGADIAATINGVEANGRANTLSVNTATLDLSVTVNSGSTTDFSFSITGGGAVFQLGPSVVSNQQARIGIGSVNSGSLGGTSGRLYQLRSGQTAALRTNTTLAATIVDQAATEVAKLRGRMGAFQRTTLESNIRALEDTASNLTSAESSIRDADFAQETSALTRAQILVQSGTAVLAIANQNPQQVLSLLGG
jgi:flagellin